MLTIFLSVSILVAWIAITAYSFLNDLYEDTRIVIILWIFVPLIFIAVHSITSVMIK